MTNFEKILLESIENNLAKIVGIRGQKAIFHFIRDHYSVDRKEIPQRLEALVSGFNTILGTGSQAILNVVLNEIKNIFGVETNKKLKMNFIDQILTMKQIVLMRDTRHHEQNPFSKIIA